MKQQQGNPITWVKVQVLVPVPNDGSLNKRGLVKAGEAVAKQRFTVVEGTGEVVGEGRI